MKTNSRPLPSALLLLAVTFLAQQPARADYTDPNEGMAMDNCPTLPTYNVPRFAVCHVKAVINQRFPQGRPNVDFDCVFEAIVARDKEPVVIANYRVDYVDGGPVTNSPDGRSTALGQHFFHLCGLYSNFADNFGDAEDLVGWVNTYIGGGSTDNVTVTESHNGNSFSVTCNVTNETWQKYCEVSRGYAGALLPTRNLKHGRDNDPCRAGCTNCAPHGMPVWHISEPYLNLWVRDTPVFYRTSLGEEVAFQINYKQRDTRPRNDGLYPTTGWNHNWYSYVHFDIPVKATLIGGDTNGSVERVSARGVSIRRNWALTNDYTQWEAILYAPDNSESYFRHSQRADPQNQRTLVPIWAGDQMTGFRLVHADGSQDIYGLMLTNAQPSYGIVERYGCVFDKEGLTNGMAGVWRLNIAGADTPHYAWQGGDDAVNYVSAPPNTDPASVQQLWRYDDTSPPAQPVEYVAGDALLTARLDPFGNAITLGYENHRLTTITDYDPAHRTTHLAYDTNGYLQTVTMPYGRTAHFGHDTNGNLLSVTDAQGMLSSMGYISADGGLNYRLASLETPYGPTHFEYQDDTAYVAVPRPSYYAIDTSSGTTNLVTDTNTLPVYVGEAGVNHAIVVTHPDNSRELYISYGRTNNLQLPAFLEPSQALRTATGAPLDTGEAGGEGSLLWRNCCHWDRAQTLALSVPAWAGMALTSLTEQDFRLGTWQHFPLEVSASGNVDLSPFPTIIREGSPDGPTPGIIRWFTYGSQGDRWHMNGEPLSWAEILEAPDGKPLVTHITHYPSSGLLNNVIEPYTTTYGSLWYRTYTWSYSPIWVPEADGTGWELSAPQALYGPGGVTRFSLNEPGTNAVGGSTVLSWPVVAVTDAADRTHQFFYNARHQLTGVKYANGLTVTNLYDQYGFLCQSIALEAQATNTYVFQDGELASLTTPLGLTVGLTHDLLGRLTNVSFPDATSLSMVFSNLDVVAAKDRLGHWSYASYDCFRQLRTLTDRNGGTTTLDYCPCGGLATVTDPLTNTTSYWRDYLGRVTNVASSAGTVSIERDSLGRPFHVTSGWGLDLRLAHNYQGLLTGVTNPAGLVSWVVFDEHDLPCEVTDDRGVWEKRIFDGLGRLTYRYDSLSRTLEQRHYNAQGLALRLDALDHPTTYGYDSAGRLCAVTNANQEVTQLAYDLPHRRLSLTDGRNHTKWWAYDIYGRQIAETNANGLLVRTNGYDANSNLTAQWTRAKGLATFTPDNKGNVLSIHYPNATINYTHDLLDRLRTMSDGVGTHTFTYTNFGAFDWALAAEAGPSATVAYEYAGPNLASISIGQWMESIARDLALRPETISSSPAGSFIYHYNGAGRQLNWLAMPGATTNFFNYDGVGNQTNIEVRIGSQTVDYHGYGYNANGWITTAQRRGSADNPATTINYSYGYDNIGQLTSVQALEPDSTLRLNEKLDYTYDASGNLATRTANTLVQAFTNDALNQLASVTRSGTLTVSGSITGAVDKLGVNGKPAQIYSDKTFATTEGLALSNLNNVFVTAGSNAAGQLVLSTITTTRLPVAVSFAYDSNGNLLSDGQRFFEWDDANQLTAVTVSNSFRMELVHDGLGRCRIVREYNWPSAIGHWQLTNEVHYVCDGYLPMQERDANNTVRVTYTRGLDLSGTFGGAGGIGGLLARTANGASAYYHADVAGNITSLTDSSGGAVGRYLHDPFGRPLGMSGPLAGANAMRFSSMPYHEKPGIVGYAFRFYDPTLQRWLNQDPIGEAGGINLYGFAGNGAVNYIDPYGLSWLSDFLFPAGQGIYDAMMGEEAGHRNPYTKGALDAEEGLVDINRNDNVLRDAMGGALSFLGEAGKEAAKAYVGGKLAEVGLGVAGVSVCKAKPLLNGLKNALRGPTGAAAKTPSLNPVFQKGFSSYEELVRYLGPAGDGRAWHHIVEQNPANVGKFGPERIHNINNIVNLPHGAETLHNKISGFYSSRAPGGGRIRDWLNTKSFDEQYDFGIRTMGRLYQP